MEIINAYKNELKKYGFYKEKYVEYSNKYEVAYIAETGMHSKANSNTRVQGSGDPLNKNLNRLQLMDDVEKYETLKGHYKYKLDNIDKSLALMDVEIGQAVREIYCLKCSTLAVKAHEIGMSEKTLRRAINKEIERLTAMPLILLII